MLPMAVAAVVDREVLSAIGPSTYQLRVEYPAPQLKKSLKNTYIQSRITVAGVILPDVVPVVRPPVKLPFR
jgi:hypothetical protein